MYRWVYCYWRYRDPLGPYQDPLVFWDNHTSTEHPLDVIKKWNEEEDDGKRKGERFVATFWEKDSGI